ncbi:23S ribosomal RNA methyltransferase Erm [Rudaeicoccus suwonensis]|uniref:23S rRNA (Adenine-N6)-dimethyltransferase n=1 Tax=Rudaeicoccus suwonensis TaxID=657409 RepID=A0A561E348_9MICO|nr:23S ribosomal RNA methyltransferase Erm [Rudaeicoccus suwonensis]TWE10043.1 23S rRNA (adenine-N6)-dimethyltransferase [Rudaeicoccus suwonensis]
MPRNPHVGSHELGQNFLVDRAAVARVIDLVSQRPGVIVEWGTGNGAITVALAELNRPVHGIEIDGPRARDLDRRTGPHVCIQEGDILRHAPPRNSVIVSNVPFHLTTPILRHLLDSPEWSTAVLITQWEVARKRAGVGGTTQMTAQWWPWYEFTLDRRIAAAAFRPQPSVDAGILIIERRSKPLLGSKERRRYQSWVAEVFRGRGRGLVDVLARQGVPRGLAQEIESQHKQSRRHTLPKDLRSQDWATLYGARRSRN